MAIGAYLAPGSVKDLKSAYVGAGGVKQVKSIWVGQNGSPRYVWPPYIYNAGEFSVLGNGMIFKDNSTVPQIINESDYIRIYVPRSWGSATSSIKGTACNDPIDMAYYKTLSVTFSFATVATTAATSTTKHLYIGGCTVQPTVSDYMYLTPNGTDYRADYICTSNDSTGVDYTLSLDLSSVSSSLYVYLGYQDTRDNGPTQIDIHVSRIAVSP